MARYIARTCPKCHDDFWVTVSHPTPQSRELPIVGWCPVCGYRLNGWRLIIRRETEADVRYGRVHKVSRR